MTSPNSLDLPASSNNKLSYVACHLCRDPLLQQHSWGLWVSMTKEEAAREDQPPLLVVGGVDHSLFEHRIRWAFCTRSPPEPKVIWKYNTYGFDLWKSYFALLPPHPQEPRTLLPGDVIVGVNGLPVSAFGGNIRNVTTYMQQCTQVFLVAVRVSSSTSSTLLPHHDSNMKHKMTSQRAQQILQLMDHAGFAPMQIPHSPTPTTTMHGWSPPPPPSSLSKSFMPSPQSSSSYPTKPQQLARIVTPDTKKTSSLPLESAPKVPSSTSWAMSKTNSSHPKTSSNTNTSTTTTNKQSNANHNSNHYNSPAAQRILFPMSYFCHRNPMFRETKRDDDDDKTTSTSHTTTTVVQHLPYDDDIIEIDLEEGCHSSKFLVKIDSANFQQWMADRKQKWRSKWNVAVAARTQRIIMAWNGTAEPIRWTNPMFRECSSDDDDDDNNSNEQSSCTATTSAATTSTKKNIPYSDNLTFDPLDGTRSKYFMSKIDSSNFSQWLSNRKRKWRSNWNTYPVEAHHDEDSHYYSTDRAERNECAVRYDFWAVNSEVDGERFDSFPSWLTTRTSQWKNLYSWNSTKRRKIQEMREEVVKYADHAGFQQWLRVRKNHWRILRRQRQRRLQEEREQRSNNNNNPQSSKILSTPIKSTGKEKRVSCSNHVVSGEFRHIDALLEEEERKQKSLEQRKPIDISFLFFPSKGCPDDVAAHCLKFLPPAEHGKLLCISKSFSKGIAQREEMWKRLCPKNWSLPRRPRKPWHEIYLSKLRMEACSSQKQWDDLLTKVAEVLMKGDQLKVVQRLIAAAEKKFNFTVDYISGVVCERNSLLNLAVIHQRHKVAHWFIEQKNADIETSDRGHFTPLLNAAWCGDKKMVRYLLQRGANRSNIGMGHSSCALATSDFKGLTASGWAEKRGFPDIAELLQNGL
ncbi:expressed unknown protein [Seminavis robusta]|uniref:Uncharacterized protein n=1 Tax=Seminavis robusta TaxID=568900 RepID=A0A9N8H1C1_9STRA|nr:expressed unknown protein [Seminavis robusta]|eukprot:Sro37_g023450.1 n/a (913) ;mRNA; f:135985-138837